MHPIGAEDYRRTLEPWCRFARPHLHRVSPDTICFGIGGHGHWPMQAHDTAFAALAVLAADPATDPARTGWSRDELAATALAMLRYTFQSHQAGGGTCADGKSWGHSWISVLGLERLMHGMEALDPLLTPPLRERIRNVLVSEAEWLANEFPVKAGLESDNNPERNLWNGAFLHRTALGYPGHARASAWREKGTALLLNSISLPEDADVSIPFAGRPLREWHRGANFLPSLALNHHGYLNVGYMVICLSNIAMLHFTCRNRKWPVPPELEWHAAELWRLIRACTFPNGRLLRIGGDTRVRYAYCQDYAIPMWLHVQDRFGDALALQHEEGWLDQVQVERAENAEGSFMGRRLARLAETSPGYHLRLEGDKAASLSMGAYWRRTVPGFPAAPAAPPVPPLDRWEDSFHGAFFHRSPRRFASWTWLAAERPQGLCLPPDGADWAEWRTNLAGSVRGLGRVHAHEVLRHAGYSFEGGFVTAGQVGVQTRVFISEGDSDEDIALVDLVFAALPDEATVLVFQRAAVRHRAYLREWKSLLWQVANDVQNGYKRRLFWDGGRRLCRALPSRGERLTLRSRWINVENRLGGVILYGSDSFILNRPADRQITIRDTPARSHASEGGGSLYAEEILLHEEHGNRAWNGGDILFDIGCALRCGEKHGATRERAATPCDVLSQGDVRAVTVRGANGIPYLLAANLGAHPQLLETPAHEDWQDVRKDRPITAENGRLRLALEPGETMLLHAKH